MMLINRYNKFDDKEVIKMAGNYNNQRYSDNHARGGSGVRSRNASYNSRGVRSGSQGSGRHSSGGGSGRNRVITNAEKEAMREKRLKKIRQKKARQRAYTYRVIFLSVCALFVFGLWKGVTGITGYIENSRQEKIDAMQNIEINKGNDAIDVAESVIAVTEASTEATVETTEAYDPTKVFSNGRYVDTTKPMVALTWDDGPNGSTGEAIMDVLEKYNGRGTFFVVGNRVDEFASEIQRMAANGHEIANHSWDHDTKLSKNSSDYIVQEFAKTNAKVQEVAGVTPVLARLPGGIISDTVKSSITMPLIFWSVDTLDWKHKDADKVVESIKSEISDGGIVLMHELYKSTQAACEEIIPWLAQQGYQLVTVSELIQFRNAEVVGGNGKQYSSFPPTETVAETTVSETAAASSDNTAASSETQATASSKEEKSDGTSSEKSSSNSEDSTQSSKSKSKSEDNDNHSTQVIPGADDAQDNVSEGPASQDNSEVIEAPAEAADDGDVYVPTEAQAAQAVSETAWWMAGPADQASPGGDAQADAIQAMDAPG
ncbi:Peptidoglycan/xylan/chitin deacetylase, PgdA/CDA1 family [Oribacterium sp. KHPX15]|nr:Peptidoglycan/xylan/chitin deacetylase, PgdA/CDA1 family [Oribacterium sp. KHPX15]